MIKKQMLSAIFLCAFLCYSQCSPIQTYEKSPEEGDLFEGDIAGIEKGAAQIPTSSRVRWPNGVIPYEIDPIFGKKFKLFFLSRKC